MAFENSDKAKLGEVKRKKNEKQEEKKEREDKISKRLVVE